MFSFLSKKIIVGIIIVLGITGIIFITVKHHLKAESPTSTAAANRVSAPLPLTAGNRQYGHATTGPNETVVAPVYDETKVTKTIGDYGGIVSTTLKNGATVYLVIPPHTVPYAGAEYSLIEYAALPTVSTTLPLQTDLSYGVDVSVPLGTDAYLVWDFSKGKDAKKITTATPKSKHCDITSSQFQPDICAMLLKIPANAIISSYFAAQPMYASDGATPVFPAYSYNIGTDNILVNHITNSVVLVPQHMSQDVVADVVSSTFSGNYNNEDAGLEAAALITALPNSAVSDDALASAASFISSEDLTYNLRSYITEKMLAARLADRVRKDNAATTTVQFTPVSAQNDLLNEDLAKAANVMIARWQKAAAAGNVVSAAYLRRAAEGRVPGAVNVLRSTVQTILATIKQTRADQADKSFDRYIANLYESAATVLGMGETTSAPTQTANGGTDAGTSNDTASNSNGSDQGTTNNATNGDEGKSGATGDNSTNDSDPAGSKTTGTNDSSNQTSDPAASKQSDASDPAGDKSTADSNGKSSSSNDSGDSTANDSKPGDASNDTSNSKSGDAPSDTSAEQDVTDAATDQINDTLNNPDASLDDAINAEALAQLTGQDGLADQAEKQAQGIADQEAQNAESDGQKAEAARDCMLTGAETDACHKVTDDLAKKVTDCSKPVDKNLSNFADQTTELGCDPAQK